MGKVRSGFAWRGTLNELQEIEKEAAEAEAEAGPKPGQAIAFYCNCETLKADQRAAKRPLMESGVRVSVCLGPADKSRALPLGPRSLMNFQARTQWPGINYRLEVGVGVGVRVRILILQARHSPAQHPHPFAGAGTGPCYLQTRHQSRWRKLTNLSCDPIKSTLEPSGQRVSELASRWPQQFGIRHARQAMKITEGTTRRCLDTGYALRK